MQQPLTAGAIAALIAVPVRVTDGMPAILPQIIVATPVIMADQIAVQAVGRVVVPAAGQVVDQVVHQEADRVAVRAVPHRIPEHLQEQAGHRRKKDYSGG